MTPTPPSPEDDLLDLAGLGSEKKAKSKASTQESDFEKELEALFAEDLAEAAETGSSLSAEAAQASPEADEAPLLLQDLIGDESPTLGQQPEEDDVLDLGGFAAEPTSPDATTSADSDDEDDILDLAAFATDGPLDLTPPTDTAGGKDGDIDLEGLDNLISDLGEPKKPAETEQTEHPADIGGITHDAPLDDMDMHGLLDELDIPPAAKPAAVEEPTDELMELSLGDLVEDLPEAEPLAQAMEAAPAASMDDLDMTLPDLGEPTPGGSLLDDLDDIQGADVAGDLALDITAGVEADIAGLGAEQEFDLSGDSNLSLSAGGMDSSAQGMDAESILGASGLGGDLLDDFEGGHEAGGEIAMDAGALLDQIEDEPVIDMTAVAAAAATMAATEADDTEVPAEMRQLLAEHQKTLAEFQQKLAELKTQVTGGSITVVSIQGQLAEKDQVISDLDARLSASEAEATALRQELAELRAALEDGLRLRGEDDEKTATVLKERLALLEDRQDQATRDMHAEIERAVPREAAKVIREEIAALAESMRD